ncbi:E3 ubiquitin-protein ligase TRIM56-like [Glandiceps talaboti]
MATGGETKFLQDIDDKFLVCTICIERYKKAKLLPCLHTFCEHCLVTLVKKTGKLNCPICRRRCKLPDGGVQAISHNFFMDQLVDQFNKRDVDTAKAKKCGGCKKSAASHRCIDCAMSLCQSCTDAHRNIPLTRTHSLMMLGEFEKTKIENPAAVQPPVYCSSHQHNQVKYYCDSCDVEICNECTLLDHPKPKHKYRYLKEVALEYKKYLIKMVEKMKMKEKEANKSKRMVQH